MTNPISILASYAMLLILLSFAPSVQAQTVQRCNSDEKMEQLYLENPSYRQEIEDGLIASATLPKPQKRMSTTTIPVHIIIVHTPGLSEGIGNNITYDRVVSQIDVLNEDFTRNNDDADDTPSDFEAVDCEIEFCLASVDPDGFETDGITRYPYSGNFENNESTVKSATSWNRLDYLNIWVVSGIGPLGWAYVPSTGSLPSANVDGVVILTSTFGGPGEATFSPYNLGRTATHEVGHYLGLEHVWGNGGCGSDDGFADTPIQSGSNSGCPNHPSPSCGNSGDMFMNYMDYVDDACMFAFTQDQADHMNQILNTSRSALSFSENTACGNGASPIDIEEVDYEDVTCPGGSDGVIEVEAIDGSAPFTFTIEETGESNSTGYFDNLEEGDYTFIVEDSSGSTAEIELEVNEPNPFFTSVTIVNEVSCIGFADGEVIIDVAGGNGFYDFDVPGQGLTSDDYVEDLAAGDYIVTVIDGEGCEVLVDFELDPPDTLHLLVDTLIGISCFGGADGSIELEGTGGSGFIDTYQVLEDGTTIEDTLFTLLALDTFTFVAEDFNGCTDTSLIVMTQPDSLQLMLDSLIAPTCFGDSSAVLILNPVGGNTTFTYLYDTFTITNDTLKGLSADTFLITAIDEKNCMDTTSFIVENPPLEEILIDELVDTECGGVILGSVALSHTSTHLPLTYTMDTETNQTGIFTDLDEGDYQVNAIDTLGCESLLEFTIATSGAAELEITVINTIMCSGDDDGSFVVDATGGTGFTFSIDGVNFQNDNTFLDLPPAEYTVYVLDSDECITQEQVMITSPDPLELSLLEKTDNVCFGEANGGVEIEVLGGTGQPLFYLDGELSSLVFTNLVAKDYTFEAIDENQCSTILEFTIEEPDQIEVTSFSSTQSKCSEDTGTLSLEAIGGTGGLSYILDGTEVSIGEFTDLSSQDYTIIIQDEAGCSIEQEIEVEQSADIELIVNSVSNESCVGEGDGALDVEVAGGIGTVTFTLNDEVITADQLNSLEPGIYTLSVEDEEGCSGFETLTIEEANPISLSVMSSQNITCNGGNDGEIIMSAEGGAGNYTYSTSSDSNSDGVFTNLDDVEYEVTVMDENGCMTSLSVTIEMPAAVQFGLYGSIAPECFGENNASVNLAASGGDGNYTFTIDGMTDNNGMIDNLEAGTYDVTIIDGNGCEGIGEVVIEEGTQVELGIMNQTIPSCKGNNDASVILVANAGNGTYNYTLDGVTNTTGLFENLSFGNYTAVVSDENDCTQEIEITIEDGIELEYYSESIPTLCANEASGTAIINTLNGNPPYEYTLGSQTNSDGVFYNLLAGEYSILISDAAGCEAEAQLSIEDTESMIVSNVITLSTICNNTPTGAFALDIEGGSGGYNMIIGGEVIDGTQASSLSAGDYSVVITDGNGCSISQSITIDDAPLLELMVSSEESPRCFDESNGQFQVTANGGTGAYEYTMGMQANTTGIFENLSANTYPIQVIDQNGCDASTTVTLTNPEELVVNEILTEDIKCADAADGSAILFAEGGTGIIEYSLNNGIPQFDSDFNGLVANEYNVIITDANGCTLTREFTLENTTAIDTQSIAITFIDINQGIPGEIVVEAVGGMEPYTYSIDGVDYQNSNTFEIEEARILTVSILDANDCLKTFDVLVDNTTLCGGTAINQVLDVSINPNPVTNSLNLSFCNSGQQSIGFTIYDDRGRLIYEFFSDYGPGAVEESIDVSNYPVGIYIIGITSDTRTNHYRFAKLD